MHKCDPMLVTVLDVALLLCFINSVPILCLKDPQNEDDIIYPKLLMVGMVVWTMLPGCWQLKDKKNSLLTIKNYLLKHNICLKSQKKSLPRFPLNGSSGQF